LEPKEYMFPGGAVFSVVPEDVVRHFSETEREAALQELIAELRAKFVAAAPQQRKKGKCAKYHGWSILLALTFVILVLVAYQVH
jgi:hypothetical protein